MVIINIIIPVIITSIHMITIPIIIITITTIIAIIITTIIATTISSISHTFKISIQRIILMLPPHYLHQIFPLRSLQTQEESNHIQRPWKKEKGK